MADSSITEYSGPFAWAVPLAISIAGGIAGALNVRGRLVGLEARVTAMEALIKSDGEARVVLRDEVLAKMKELASEIRKDVPDHPPDSLLLPQLHGIVDGRVAAAVSSAMAEANEKHLERIMDIRDRVSEITGQLKGILGGRR